ncbi:MAG: DEAD/DEAH box helicase family protein [Fimbriimonadales bacterium]
MNLEFEGEAQTRKRRVDIRLHGSKWTVVPYGTTSNGLPVAITEHPTLDGPADYVLNAQNVRLAAVEAKRVTRGAYGVLTQAQRYARGFDAAKVYQDEYALPFGYSTNGEQIFFQDLRDPLNLSREVQDFHTPNALLELLAKDADSLFRSLQETPVEDVTLRPYQVEAVQSVEDAIRERRRKMLVAMATGTGKTRTTVALIYHLMRCGLAKRVLFLVDRRALAAQAMQEFSSYQTPYNRRFSDEYEVYGQRFQTGDIDEEDNFDPKVLPNEYLTNPDGKEAFVYVSTIQRMRINLFGRPEGFYGSDTESEEDAPTLEIPIHAFDLIVADECHRGYTSSEDSKWREVLQHFDGIQIGLTATPASHTTAYFNHVVFRYTYEQAVAEGYLSDYDAYRIESEFRQKGLFLHEGDEVQLLDSSTGDRIFDTLEAERELAPQDIENNWTSVDSNRKIVRAYLELARAHEERTGRFPKTLFFAENDIAHSSHADQLTQTLREELNQGDVAVQKITGNSDRPLRLIKTFRNRPDPKVAVTVDLLSTGVDIRPLEFIVLVRPIKSRILFEQILGRGTRTCSEINKDHFVVIDCLGILDYFKDASAFTDTPPAKPTRTIADIIGDIWRNKDKRYNIRVLTKRIQRVAKATTGEGKQRFSDIVTDCTCVSPEIESFASELSAKLESNWGETMALLRSPAFQDFIENYPRPQRTFIVDQHSEDTVTVDPMIGAYKPEDYISIFERFIRENANRIAELDILLHRPREFSLAVLEELRRKLRTAEGNFTEDKLRRAYGRPLADIISLVKHAATGEPILNQTERVDRAIEVVKSRLRDFSVLAPGQPLATGELPKSKVADSNPPAGLTTEQEKWIELIRQHLHSSLLIGAGDFDLPEFAARGATRRRIDAEFGGKLAALVHAINEQIAA